MEFKFIFVLITLVLFLADLWTKAKSKLPPQPEQPLPVPEQPDLPKQKPAPVFNQAKPADSVNVPEYAPINIDTQRPAETKPAGWDNKLEPSLVLNGIIFAEVIQPPRALRPIQTRFGRRR
jgi:hypothetical protein